MNHFAIYHPAAAAKSLQSCPTLCDPTDGSLPGSPVLGFFRQEHGAGCHFLLQCMKLKSESEVAQSCTTLRDPMECSLPGFSVHGIFQARLLEWAAISFSNAWNWKVKGKSLSRVWLLATLPGSSIHGIFQARILEWGAIAFSVIGARILKFIACYKILVFIQKDSLAGSAILDSYFFPLRTLGQNSVF